jgi:hypothetical protein
MEQMNVATLLAAIAIIALGALQYTLMINGIRDLVRRPRVRGDNKVLWGLAILCIPFAGALIYGWMGPTSFLSRPQADHSRTTRATRRPEVASNVTPITQARSAQISQAKRATTPVPTRIRSHKTGS